MWVKFHQDRSKTKGPVWVASDPHTATLTEGKGQLDSSVDDVSEYKYFIYVAHYCKNEYALWV